MMNDESPLWTTSQTAEFLGFPVSTLNKWRRIRELRQRLDQCNEGACGAPNQEERDAIAEMIERVKGPKLSGPPFKRIGARKVRYRKSDVLSWAENPE